MPHPAEPVAPRRSPRPFWGHPWSLRFGIMALIVAGSWAIATPQAEGRNGPGCAAAIADQGRPTINQAHIFCGLFRRGNPVGFHSRPGGRNPSTVARSRITQSPDARGIYGIEWSHVENPDRPKFSTMFPDRCTASQVLTSVRHAATNPSRCPARAPSWAWCGANQPANLTAVIANRYCRSNNGAPYTIAGATLNDGTINTAFPLR